MRARVYTETSGVLLAASPIPLAAAAWAQGSLWPATISWVHGVLLLAVSGLLVGGLVVPFWVRTGRVAASLGVLGLLALAAPRLAQEPQFGLTMLLVTAASLALLWQVGAPLFGPATRRNPLLAGRARGAALTAAGFWLAVALLDDQRAPLVVAAVAMSMTIAAGFGVAWVCRGWRLEPVRAHILLGALVVTAGLCAMTGGDLWSMATSGAVYASVAVLFGPRPRRSDLDTGGWWGPLLAHPKRMFVGTFALLAAFGTLLLGLPHSAATGQHIGLVDAAFTSVSAVCVTGLAVRDTPVEFSAFGQGVILLLIQMGGLGIMTFSTAALRVLGRRISLRHETAVASLIGTHERDRLVDTAQRILWLTFLAESIGAALMLPVFLAQGDGVGMALWRAVFTSVSAFCNAGFALQSDSLMAYQHSALVLHVVGALIVLGGLSPLAVFGIPALVRRRSRPVSAQAKICLAAAGGLLLLGFLFILATEWDNTLDGLSLLDKLNNAWFQSCTLRTAGFNSIDVAAVRPATLAVMMLLMFIGGSPGGTAGGIKTTTVFVLLASVVRAIRGHWSVDVFGREVAERTIRKAAVTATVAVALLGMGVIALLLTQATPFVPTVFEVVSALGTVGLTIGTTADLDSVGKFIVLVCMFVGRVGGLTMLMFMGQRSSPERLRRPEEEIDVG